MLLQLARLSNRGAQVYRFNSGGVIGGSRMEQFNTSGKLHVCIRPRFHQVRLLISWILLHIDYFWNREAQVNRSNSGGAIGG